MEYPHGKPSEFIRKGWCQKSAAENARGDPVDVGDPMAVKWCPIELALHDLGILKPCVSANEWYPDLEPGAIVQEWLPLTRRAKRFIRDFDATGKAEPATFRLPLTTSPS